MMTLRLPGCHQNRKPCAKHERQQGHIQRYYRKVYKMYNLHLALVKANLEHCESDEADDPDALAGRLNSAVKDHCYC